MHTRRQFLGELAIAASAGVAVRGLARESTPWHIGCYTRPWAAFDYRTAFDGIAAAGFLNVGLMTTRGKNNLIVSESSTPAEVAAVAAEAKQRKLKIVSIWGGSFALDRTEGLKKLIDHADACECPHLLLGGTSDAQQKAYFKIVAECCDHAAARKVVMGIKPHGGINASGAQCRKLVDAIAHAHFRVWYDPGNIFYYSHGQLDPIDDVASVDGVVSGMSVKDFKPPQNVDLTPGTGKVDFTNVLARLRKGGMNGGPLVVECLAPGDLSQVNAEAVKARQFLERLTGQQA